MTGDVRSTEDPSGDTAVAPAQIGARLTGKIAFVTGSANGIGLAIARRFALEGALVVVSDLDVAQTEEAAARVQADVETVGGTGGAIPIACNVAKGQDISQAFRLIAQDHGRLDIIVNNAGINVRGDFRHMSDADWEAIRDVNLDGVIRVARDGFELMKAAGAASLINLASIMGHRGLRQLTGYSATKGAVSALTRGLAVEYAPFGIRVNAIAPGFIETALTKRVLRNPMFSKALLDQTPLRRFGTGDEIASAAVFLSSDDAAFITGAELAVDGGMAAGL